MEIKLRERPFSVYLHCCSKAEAGREAIFVAGANDGKLRVHETGIKAIVGILRLAPDDPQVKDENRRPITQIGISNLVVIELALWRKDRESDPENVEVTFESNAEIGSCNCEVIELRHLKPTDKTQFYMTRMWFDSRTKFPIQVEHYDWPRANQSESQLLERYTYRNIKTNVGLSDSDFDIHNTNYAFGK